MESGAIPDSNITAISWWDHAGVKHPPYMARLNGISADDYSGFWVPASTGYGKCNFLEPFSFNKYVDLKFKCYNLLQRDHQIICFFNKQFL